MPTPEQIADFKGKYQKKPIENFEDAEKYMLMIITIPQFQKRLECWRFTQNFASSAGYTLSCLKNLRKAIDAVKKNENLKLILGYTLSFGNYMNAGTKKGQAVGFKFTNLDILSQTKDKTNRLTLLHYIVVQLSKNHPEALNLPNELECVNQTLSINFKEITQEVEKMGQNLSSKRNFIYFNNIF